MRCACGFVVRCVKILNAWLGLGWVEMEFEADFEFEADEETVRAVYESIKEEQERGTDMRRSVVDLALNGDTLRVSMHGEDATKLRAVANTWLRLLKVAAEMVQVVKECGTSGF